MGGQPLQVEDEYQKYGKGDRHGGRKQANRHNRKGGVRSLLPIAVAAKFLLNEPKMKDSSRYRNTALPDVISREIGEAAFCLSDGKIRGRKSAKEGRTHELPP